MQIGIIGAGTPSMAGLLAHMTQVAFAGRGFRYVYKNPEENEYFSKSYTEDTVSNRGEFLQILGSKGFNYSDRSALNFSTFIDNEQLFKEVI